MALFTLRLLFVSGDMGRVNLPKRSILFVETSILSISIFTHGATFISISFAPFLHRDHDVTSPSSR